MRISDWSSDVCSSDLVGSRSFSCIGRRQSATLPPFAAASREGVPSMSIFGKIKDAIFGKKAEAATPPPPPPPTAPPAPPQPSPTAPPPATKADATPTLTPQTPTPPQPPRPESHTLDSPPSYHTS